MTANCSSVCERVKTKSKSKNKDKESDSFNYVGSQLMNGECQLSVWKHFKMDIPRLCVSMCVWEFVCGNEWKKGPFCVSLSDSEVFCQLLNGIRYTGWDSIARLISWLSRQQRVSRSSVLFIMLVASVSGWDSSCLLLKTTFCLCNLLETSCFFFLIQLIVKQQVELVIHTKPLLSRFKIHCSCCDIHWGWLMRRTCLNLNVLNF